MARQKLRFVGPSDLFAFDTPGQGFDQGVFVREGPGLYVTSDSGKDELYWKPDSAWQLPVPVPRPTRRKRRKRLGRNATLDRLVKAYVAGLAKSGEEYREGVAEKHFTEKTSYSRDAVRAALQDPDLVPVELKSKGGRSPGQKPPP